MEATKVHTRGGCKASPSFFYLEPRLGIGGRFFYFGRSRSYMLNAMGGRRGFGPPLGVVFKIFTGMGLLFEGIWVPSDKAEMMRTAKKTSSTVGHFYRKGEGAKQRFIQSRIRCGSFRFHPSQFQMGFASPGPRPSRGKRPLGQLWRQRILENLKKFGRSAESHHVAQYRIQRPIPSSPKPPPE